MKKVLIALMASIAATVSASAETTHTTADGGLVQTNLGYGIVVNDDSTLRREWVAVHDSNMPVAFVETPGVTTIFERDDYGGDYWYSARYKLEVKQPLVAVSVNFILFDVWGERTKVLDATDIEDMEVGFFPKDAKWRAYSENEISEYYASVAYVARARGVDGQIYFTDTDAVLAVAQKYMSDFTEEMLEEDPPQE